MQRPVPMPGRVMQRARTVRHRASVYHDAIAIVEAEYADELRLDDVAHRVAASRRQLQRAYAEIGATTFRRHLTALRMQRAAELLATGTFSVRDVGQRVGYRHGAQFAKSFRRHHGITPSAFREIARRDRQLGSSTSGPSE